MECGVDNVAHRLAKGPDGRRHDVSVWRRPFASVLMDARYEPVRFE